MTIVVVTVVAAEIIVVETVAITVVVETAGNQTAKYELLITEITKMPASRAFFIGFIHPINSSNPM
jgi:uncharacterized membrane protein (Fun14 family)